MVEILLQHSRAYALSYGSNDPYRRLCRMTVLSSDLYPRPCSNIRVQDQGRMLTWISLPLLNWVLPERIRPEKPLNSGPKQRKG